MVSYNLPQVMTFLTQLFAGDVEQNYTDILKQQQLPVLNPLPMWATPMDSVIVNGKTYSGGSVV